MDRVAWEYKSQAKSAAWAFLSSNWRFDGSTLGSWRASGAEGREDRGGFPLWPVAWAD